MSHSDLEGASQSIQDTIKVIEAPGGYLGLMQAIHKKTGEKVWIMVKVYENESGIDFYPLAIIDENDSLVTNYTPVNRKTGEAATEVLEGQGMSPRMRSALQHLEEEESPGHYF